MYEAGVDPVFSRGVCTLNLHFFDVEFCSGTCRNFSTFSVTQLYKFLLTPPIF